MEHFYNPLRFCFPAIVLSSAQIKSQKFSTGLDVSSTICRMFPYKGHSLRSDRLCYIHVSYVEMWLVKITTFILAVIQYLVKLSKITDLLLNYIL